MADKKDRYITVKHGRVTLLCRPLAGPKDSFFAIGTFTNDAELRKLMERVEAEQ